MSNKTQTLGLLKKYYEDFYNKNAATNPNKVENIRYFMHWLESADENCLTVKEEIVYTKRAKLDLKLIYFFKISSDRYSSDYTVNGSTACYFTTSKKLPEFFGDMYYSEQASSSVYPANLNKAANERGRKLLHEMDTSGSGAIFSEAIITNVNFGEPMEETILDCTVTYPHHIADKDGKYERSFDFLVYCGEMLISDESGPVGENGKKINNSKSGGCYVATCVYGSYDCPEVWTLRRYRDNILGSTWYGRAFISIYYAISPTIVKMFGNTKWFKKLWKNKLDKMVNNLNIKGVENTPYNDKNW